MSDVVYKYELNNQELNFSKKLMCIEYPGLVNNVDKMVQTLGGIHNIGIVIHFYNSQKIKDPHADSHIIGRTRKKRKGHTIFITSKEEMIPKKPKAESLKMLHVKFLNDGPYDQIKKLFDERPVWSKNALIYQTNYSKDQLKHLLPTVAYYFVTGPWRVMWVRYGFDPRLDPNSRIYQTFDYRMRTVGGLKNKIKAKRSYSNCLLPYKNSPACRPKVAIISRHTMAKAYQKAKESSEQERHDENLYIFRPGFIPPFRQMFYQYCDVHVPEIQAMINRIPIPDPETTKCDYRTGWFPSEFDARCREIVSNLVAAEIKRQMFEQQKQKKRQQEFDNEIEETYDENYDEEYYDGQEYNEEQENNFSRTEIEISDSSSNDSDLDFILETDAESDVMVDTD